MRKLSFWVVLLISFWVVNAYSQSFSGTYVSNQGGITLTLVLNQDNSGNLTGSLASSNGTKFILKGKINGGSAVGIVSDNQGGLYFEVHFQGDDLVLVLVEPGPDNSPNYNSARQVIFSSRGGSETPSEPSPAVRKKAGKARTPQPAAPAQTPASGGAEVSDPSWSFKFKVPAGWTFQKSAEGAVLGHNTIAGAILVLAHSSGSEEVQSQMRQGLQEEGVQLALQSGLSRFGSNAIAGDYTGYYNGQPVKARVIGTFSQNGGGAYIIALAAQAQFNQNLVAAAEAVAKSFTFIQAPAGGGDLVNFFAGTWSTSTSNSSRSVTLYPNGTFSEYSESYYGGQLSNQYGDNTGSWSAGGPNKNGGKWTVSGTRQKGVITLIYNSGERLQVRYEVHVENGKTYWNEYYFEGQLWSKR